MTTADQSPAPETPENEPETIQIGAFSGYNRRPQPANSGLTANFYGENGTDSDSISALSLTKYQEIEVYISVFLIKDGNGRIMKDAGTGNYPRICAFLGKIQRPKPQRDGMLAQFFASNGPDADQVNELGLSKYLDAFVYVEILRPEAAKNDPLRAPAPAVSFAPSPGPTSELDELATHLTPVERKALAKKTKAFQEANRLLSMSGFLKVPAVWTALGSEAEYQAWLSAVPCCAPGEKPCIHAARAFKLPVETHVKYGYLPLCESHAKEAEQGAMPGGLAFLRMRSAVFVQEWAWEELKKAVGTPTGFDEPDPQKVMSWAVDHKLSQHIPPNYLNRFG